MYLKIYSQLLAWKFELEVSMTFKLICLNIKKYVSKYENKNLIIEIYLSRYRKIFE